MPFDGADFAAWLLEQGTIEAYVPIYVEAAIRLSQTAPVQPVDPSHIDAFLAKLGDGDVSDDRVAMFRRAGAALLRYQSTARGGRVTFSGLDENAVAAAAVKPPEPEIAPYLVEGDQPIRPLPSAVPIARDRFRDPARTRRIIVIGAAIVLVMAAAISTLASMVDAFRYRSHLVPPDFYSEHLQLDLRFPRNGGWRHMTGGDRVARYDDLLPPVQGRSEGAEVWTSSFFRGEDPRNPDLGLSLALVPLLVDFWNSGQGPDEMRRSVGQEMVRVFAEYMAVRGGKWTTRYCGIETKDPRRPLICTGNIYRQRKTFYVTAWVIFGRDHIAVAEFRSPDVTEEKRQEGASIITPLRI